MLHRYKLPLPRLFVDRLKLWGGNGQQRGPQQLHLLEEHLVVIEMVTQGTEEVIEMLNIKVRMKTRMQKGMKEKIHHLQMNLLQKSSQKDKKDGLGPCLQLLMVMEAVMKMKQK